MPSLHAIKSFIEHKSYLMRVSSITMSTTAGSGHPTSALSAADIVATLFFYAMRFDPTNPHNPYNDRFILSKGHAALIVYAAWKELGVLSEEELLSYRKIDSVLEGHPTHRFSRTEAATGSLGNGLGIGIGMALAMRLDELDSKIYVLMGDSEITEGSVWEACEVASLYKTENLIAIVDCNRLGQSMPTIHEYHMHRYEEKFKAFGWEVITVDGHDVLQLMSAFDKARTIQGRPIMILAKTYKGYGVDTVENKEGFHGKVFQPEELASVLKKMALRFPKAAQYQENYAWQPHLPSQKKILEKKEILLKTPAYKKNEAIPTRLAFGHALQALGVNHDVVSLDAEVKNSTYALLFEEKYPQRFFQCLIAEQNMINMAIGFHARGKIPFASTFGCFFSRAHDQIRMAAIGTAALRLVGSHAGVSIGQDGPSQMALEDIGMMAALPDSVVLYPADAISTYKLVGEMAHYTKGISYLRTTRGATPVIYENHDEFSIGGCKILKQSAQDKVCLIAAGITVFEALKAYEFLQNAGISIAVIDAYSIKPLAEAIATIAVTTGKVITVEDHYIQGGLGQAVTYELRNACVQIQCLAVEELPRSGKPEELLLWAGIDASSITAAVKKMLE